MRCACVTILFLQTVAQLIIQCIYSHCLDIWSTSKWCSDVAVILLLLNWNDTFWTKNNKHVNSSRKKKIRQQSRSPKRFFKRKDGCNPCVSLHCRCTVLLTKGNITSHALIGNDSLCPPAKHAEVLPSTFMSDYYT